MACRAVERLGKYRCPDAWASYNYVTPDGLRLGSWCQNKKTNIKRGVLSEDHLAQLKEIGFE
ncbi:MAG: helicase associated domain-containing protein [Candidatus Acidiferrales bacterium]